MCVNLNAYIGSEIVLRFASQTSSSTVSATFDDITVYPDDGPCPTHTPVPTHTPPPPTDPRPSNPTPVAVMAAAEATPAIAALTAQDAAPPAAESTAEPESALAGSTTHRIKSGETLSEIAATYGVSMQAIIQVNGFY